MSPQSETSSGPGWHATTILSVRKGGQVVMAGDGQVSMGQTIVKGNAKKVRRLGNGQIISGFAGATFGVAGPQPDRSGKIKVDSCPGSPALRQTASTIHVAGSLSFETCAQATVSGGVFEGNPAQGAP